MKKVISIVLICLVVALVAATAITGIVKTNYYNPIEENALQIRVYKDGEENHLNTYTSSVKKDRYDKINSLMQDAFTETILISLFQGNLSTEDKLTSGSVDLESKLTETDNNLWLIFVYSTDTTTGAKTLKKNGENYLDLDKSEDVDRTVSYYKMAVKLVDTDNLAETTIYLDTNYQSTKFTCSYKITTLAHLSDVYNYVTENYIAD